MLIKIAVGLLIVVTLLVVVIASRPSAFRIARSLTIAAPANVIFALLADFHRWGTWSPYDKLDPDTRKSFEGAASGVGAIYHYIGAKIGEGRMTITESEPATRLAIRAEFIKPFAAINEILFTLEPTAGGTSVTWAMTGHNNFAFKAFSLFVNVDQMIGKEFETGLADLAVVANSATTDLRSSTGSSASPTSPLFVA